MIFRKLDSITWGIHELVMYNICGVFKAMLFTEFADSVIVDMNLNLEKLNGK